MADIESRQSKSSVFSTFVAVFAPFTFGLGLGSIPSLISRVAHDISDTCKAVQYSMPLIFVAALISNSICNCFNGYFRTKLFIADFLFIFAALFCINISEFGIYISRFLFGLGAAIATSTAPCYLGSISSPRIKLFIGAFITIGILSGCLSGTLMNFYSHESYTLIILPIIIPLIHSILLQFTIRAPTLVPEPESVQMNEMACTASTTQQSKPAVLKDLLVRQAIRSLSILATTHFAQHFSGIDHIVMMAPTMFADSSIYHIMVGFYLIAILSTLFSVAAINKFGTKSLFLFSSLIATFSCLAIASNLYPKIALFIYVFGFNLGLGPIPYTIIGEVVPIQLVQHASFFATSCNWLAGLATTSLIPLCLDKLKNNLFYGYALFTVIFMAMFGILYNEKKTKANNFQ